MKNSRMKRACALLVASTFASPAFAGLFSVTPVRIFMAPRDRATAVTITNEGDEELVMQADVYTWAQKPNGEDDLQLSEDLILSPPIIKLAPRSRQVLRLAMVRPQSSQNQVTYRLIVREVPEARQQDDKVQLQVALAFSLPVFITPQGAKRKLDCAATRQASDTVKVTCENSGNAYAQPKDFVLSDGSGRKLATRDIAMYILPGIKRSFDMKSADGPIPAGAHKLGITLDDGTSQTYDVTVPQ